MSSLHVPAKGNSKKPLRPPQLSSIVRDNNVLQLEDQQLEDALENSRKYWYQLASLAYGLRGSGLIPEFTNPCHALHKIPRLQLRSKKFHVRPFGTSPTPGLCLEASATWKLPAYPVCDRLEQEITRSALLQVGTGTPIQLGFNENIFSFWSGSKEENAIGPNYLGILAMGWCYILSARLIEIQGDGASMRYTSCKTGDSNDSVPCHHQTFVVNVGEADENVVGWWTAVLAQKGGWKAVVRRTPKREFLAPWSISRTDDMCFSIKHKGLSSSSAPSPLSSRRAFDALTEFARLHGLYSQVPIALAMALTIPTHQYYRSVGKIPLPKATGARTLNAPVEIIPSLWTSLEEDLPYYMTLSCSPEVMMSTFSGAFWESDIPCNLVSPWLHPVLKEVLGETSDIKVRESEVLAYIGSIRQPRFSAFWFGAIASGLGPEIIRRVGGGRPPLDPLAYPWTGYPQSFMDIAGSGPYICDDQEYISRADVWRLMHLPSNEEDNTCYQYRPNTPWEPCGASHIKDCALRVKSHLQCSRHEYQYDHWNWSLEDGTIYHDHGYSKQPALTSSDFLLNISDIKAPKVFERTYLDQRASREASLEIFRWFSISGEGLPPESIYQDDWLKEIWDDEEFGGDADEIGYQDLQAPADDTGSRLESWLNSIG
ncbi:hypothetical protein BDV59DRAFT_211432 [Aspergillus ambiguus]|uniref:uncharacterized protein n=1 Tax=Aspergillus ambiguus TaxID=176160 RepID=UPI003CCE4A05